MTRALLLRGRVHTNDPARPFAEAVLVRGNRIEAVGSLSEVAPLARGADELDAGQGAVLPGLVDGHAHPVGLGRALVSVRLEDARSIDEVVRACRAWADANPTGWVLGRGWDQTLWGGPDALPEASALDAAFPDRPLYLSRVDGHAALANRAALRAAGLRDDARDPPGGRLVRRADGTLSGALVDAAMELVSKHVPAATREQRESWLVASARHCLSHGITGVHDAGVGPDTDEAYVSLASSGALLLRTYAMADLLDPKGLGLVERGPRREQGLYEVRAVKLFADGALGSRGAELFEPYADDPGNTGLVVQGSERVLALAGRAARAGFQVCVHAIGDRANARVLDVFESLVASGVRLERPRIEHAQILRTQDLPRLRALGAIAAMQPVHATTDMRFAARRLGEARLAGAYAWRTLLELGVVVSFGSDFPVEPADVRAGFHAAITRTDRNHEPAGGWRPAERVTPDQALEAFTSANAWASFREHELGRIAPGFLADLTVLDADPFAGASWLDAGVRATIVDGDVRFEAR